MPQILILKKLWHDFEEYFNLLQKLLFLIELLVDWQFFFVDFR